MKLSVVCYPDPRLRVVCDSVIVNDEVRAQFDAMLSLMREQKAFGIAAPQVGISKRMIIIDIKDDEYGNRTTSGQPIFMANPEIIDASEEKIARNERCLSYPGIIIPTFRHKQITVKYFDYNGHEQVLTAKDWQATCIQHERDHLDGIDFADPKLFAPHNKLKVVFMGTSPFAVPALKSLIEMHDVIAVYTASPKPAGRGHKEQISPVHELALKHNIQVRTPKTLRSQEELDAFWRLNADIAVVASYGMILPKEILTAPKFGAINIHPSLLPRWRGAAPIERTILAGDKQTALCIMQMDEGLDTGDILLQENYEIKPGTNSGQLHDIMANKGAENLLVALEQIRNCKETRTKQSDIGATYAQKLSKQEALIDWNQTSEQIMNQILGFYPNLCAYFIYNGQQIKVHKAEIVQASIYPEPGTLLDDNLLVATKDGAIRILELQKPGKGAMKARDFLNGNKMPAGQHV